jgi:hypothetical protein
MRHARAEDLDLIEDLLAAIRRMGGLKEKSRGVFYVKTRPTLHFHQDPKGMFADLRNGDDFDRYPVNTKAERGVLLKRVAAVLVGID